MQKPDTFNRSNVAKIIARSRTCVVVVVVDVLLLDFMVIVGVFNDRSRLCSHAIDQQNTADKVTKHAKAQEPRAKTKSKAIQVQEKQG